MKHSKVFIGLLCLSALVLGACSCSNNSKNPSSSLEEESEVSEVTPSDVSEEESEQPASETSQEESEEPASEGTSEDPLSEEQSEEPSSETSQEESEESQDSSSGEHVHDYAFDHFEWTTTPGNYTAIAIYRCGYDDESIEYDAAVTKISSTLPTCTVDGQNVWQAKYEDHEENNIEIIEAQGHLWGEPVWNWTANLTQCTATFTCERDPEHVEVLDASISEVDHVDATCVMDGYTTYRASVTLDNIQYTNDRNDVMPAYEHSDIDIYGFCELCGEYMGQDIPDPDMDTVLDGMQPGSYYYRFNIDEHYKYKKSFSGPLASEFHFYAKYSDEWQPVTIGLNYATIPQPDDDYVYLTLTPAQEIPTGYFRIDIACAHIDGPNYYGICEHCNEYLGTTISLSQYDQDINIPATDGDEYMYMRVELEVGKHITLYENQDWSGHELDVEEYYVSDIDLNFSEISKDNFNGLHVNAPTSNKDFFKLSGDDYDGYLYMVFHVESQYGLDGSDTIRVSGEHFADDYGFCALGDGEYLGSTVASSQFNTMQSFNYNRTNPVFYRLEEIYHANDKSSDYEHVQYKISSFNGANREWFTFYYVANGEFVEVPLDTSSWYELPSHPDDEHPYIYFVFVGPNNATGSVNFTLSYTI